MAKASPRGGPSGTSPNRPTEDEVLLSPPTRSERPDALIHSDPWRVLRITGEFVEGFDALADVSQAVTIFGSARTLPEDPMYGLAVDVARRLGEAGCPIITGGGPGIMAAGNKGAREAKALSIGLNIELPFEQGLNAYVDRGIEFRYFFVRKTMFIKYSNAFVVFPGGFGTFDELFEALTLIQTDKVKNFPVVLIGTRYWQGLIDWLTSTVMAEGKIGMKDLDLLLVTDDPAECVKHILAARAKSVGQSRD